MGDILLGDILLYAGVAAIGLTGLIMLFVMLVLAYGDREFK